jgi:hypothetical protein
MGVRGVCPSAYRPDRRRRVERSVIRSTRYANGQKSLLRVIRMCLAGRPQLAQVDRDGTQSGDSVHNLE